MLRRFAAPILLSFAALASGGGCADSGPDAEERAAIAREIRAMLDRQTEAWNAFDLDAFVSDYLDSPSTRFVSGGTVRRGIDDLLERYRRNYPDEAAMGRLHFSDLDIRVLSRDAAVVFGRYNLEREHDAPTGLFTLVVERTGDGWKISHDHTSGA